MDSTTHPATGLVSTILRPIAANLSAAASPLVLRRFEFTVNSSSSTTSTTTTMSSLLADAGLANGEPSNISMDDLYPALVQCFGIIVCGYLAGLLKIISNHETKGLNTFVGTFALPSLIFMSLVELNWRTVNWTFLLAILIAKSIVFFSVGIITLLVSRPINYGRAGILATFCTQSNDFAIGYPILMALYQRAHPEYASYLYLMAPISLAILNPIGYVLMEISKMQAATAATAEAAELAAAAASVSGQQPSTSTGTATDRRVSACPAIAAEQQSAAADAPNRKYVLIMKTMQSIAFNPILFMTVLGVIGGVTFPNGLPVIVSGVLKVFGNSFSATALFLLGLRMLGTGSETQRPGFLTPAVLIIVKLLALPLVNRQMVNLMHAGANVSDTTDLSTYAFLYGTFPSAPGVFVIATQYQTDIDLIATSMVACTFISGPLMFISAKMISLTNLNPADYLHELDNFALDISCVGLVACVWVLVLFGLTNRYKRMPQRVTCCLVMSQFVFCIGIVMWATLGSQPGWAMYLQFALFTIGSYSSRLWTAILAISMLFLQCRSLCFVLKLWPWFVGIAWGVPTLLVSALLIIDYNSITPDEKRNPSFQYGNAQAAISVFLLVTCFLVTVGCLVLHQRYKKRFERYMTLSKEVSTDTTDITQSTACLIARSESTDDLPIASINFNINNRVRQSVRNCQSNAIDQDDGYNNAAGTSTDTPAPATATTSNGGGGGCSQNEDCCSRQPAAQPIVLDIEDLMARNTPNGEETDGAVSGQPMPGTAGPDGMCGQQYGCGGVSRQTCQSMLNDYQSDMQAQGLEPLEREASEDELQTMRHTVLLIVLLCGMFVTLALSIWTLVMEGMSGIYVELAFLDAFLNFGQPIIVLACFITNTGDLFPTFTKYWRKMWYGANTLQLPTELAAETRLVCEQFTVHHLDSCRRAIADDKRWRIRVYKKCFYGVAFVDWLQEVGLAKDRMGATLYARHLVDGRVLRHINNAYHFYDKNLLYTFCSRL